MKGTYLGEFEELILLTVAVLNGEAYGVSIASIIEEEANRSVTISTIHNVLYRLEKKGFVTSRLGGATAERGGRNKRLFSITATGHEALNQSNKLRNRLWGLMPELKF
ncbi:MAG: PadR family transcriptional regulator [Bacteroidota bacterium]